MLANLALIIAHQTAVATNWQGIDLQFEKGKYTVIATINNQPGRFLIDTGSPDTYLSQEFIDRLSPGTQIADDIQLHFAFKLGKGAILPARAYVDDPFWKSKDEENLYDGVIGWDILRTTILELSSPFSVLWISSNVNKTTDFKNLGIQIDSAKSIPLNDEKIETGPYIPLSDKKTKDSWSALFDTGSFGTLMPDTYKSDTGKKDAVDIEVWFMGQSARALMLTENDLEIPGYALPMNGAMVLLEPVEDAEPIVGLFTFLQWSGIILSGPEKKLYWVKTKRNFKALLDGYDLEAFFETNELDMRSKIQQLNSAKQTDSARQQNFQPYVKGTRIIYQKFAGNVHINNQSMALLFTNNTIVPYPAGYRAKYDENGNIVEKSSGK